MADRNDILGEYERAIEARRKLEAEKAAREPQPTAAQIAEEKRRAERYIMEEQKRVATEVDTIINSLPERARRAGESGASDACIYKLITKGVRVWSGSGSPKEGILHNERESEMFKSETGRLLLQRLKTLGLRYYIEAKYDSQYDRSQEDVWYENQREELYVVFDKNMVSLLDEEEEEDKSERGRGAMIATVKRRYKDRRCAVCGRGKTGLPFFFQDEPTLVGAELKYKGEMLDSSEFSGQLVVHMKCRRKEFQPGP